MYKQRKYLLTAPPLCSALPLKTEVYARGAGCNFDFAATNGTVVACDGLAKITITHNNNGSTLPAGAIIEYRLDMGTWQTSNVITGVSYADHVVSIRMTNGSQICYATKNLAAVLFSDCGVLSCDFRIVAKDGTNNETSTLARDPATKGLKTLKLSLESFDGSDLSKGVTYYWERFAKNPNDAGGSKVFVSSQAAVSIGAVGRYTVALVRGSITCTTEIAINSKPCLDTPEPTTKCETKALTGVSDEIANRLTDLAVGDVVRCGDFNVTIIEATGGPFEGWTGKGYVTVPYVNATVSIILKKAVFNDCYQLTNANATAELPTVFTEYDASWGNIADVDNIINNFRKSLQEVIDILNNFSGKCEDVRALDKAVKEYEQGFSQANSTYTEAERIAMLAKITDLKTKRDQLVSCSSCSVSGGRIAAATDATVDCGPKAIECRNKLNEMLGSAKTFHKVLAPQSIMIYVNGYWNNSKLQKDWLNFSDGELLSSYWGSDFKSGGKGYLFADKEYFVNGAGSELSSGSDRYEKGKKFAEDRIKNKSSNFYQKVILPTQDENGNYMKPIYIVSHSMGAAFSEGMISILSKAGIKIEKVYHFSPADNSDFSVNIPAKTIQVDILPDPVLALKNINDYHHIKGVIHWGLLKNSFGSLVLGHAYTKSRAEVWQWADNIEKSSVTLITSFPSKLFRIDTPITTTLFYLTCINGFHYEYTGDHSPNPPYYYIYKEGLF